MLRKEREVKDTLKIKEIIDTCKVLRVAINDEDGIYILPVNFGYNYDNDELTLYFHGAKRGKKYDLISKGNENVGIEMACNHQLVEGVKASDYSFKYASIIGKGYASIVDDVSEKEFALNKLMIQQTGKSFELSDKDISCVTIFKIKVVNFSAKQYK